MKIDYPNLAVYVFKHKATGLPDLYISADEWRRLTTAYRVPQLTRALWRVVTEHNIRPPMTTITPSQAAQQLGPRLRADRQALRALNIDSLLQRADGRAVWRTNDKGKDLVPTWCIKPSSVGMGCSAPFHNAQRAQVSTHRFKSLVEHWNDRRLFKMSARMLVTSSLMASKAITAKTIETAINLRGGYIASQFRPATAKAVYELFGGGDVLDTSAGWGDRLAAAACSPSVKSYRGLDPNPNLAEGYAAQIKAYRGFGVTKPLWVQCVRAEKWKTHQWFNLLFTSPPYFDTERYSDHPDQSWRRYQTLHSWLYDFLFVTLRTAWNALYHEGYMLVNLSDLGKILAPGSPSLCREVVNHVNGTFPEAHFMGVLGMRLGTRPGTSIVKSQDKRRTLFCEPIFVWRKGGKPITLDQHILAYLDRHSVFNALL